MENNETKDMKRSVHSPSSQSCSGAHKGLMTMAQQPADTGLKEENPIASAAAL